jgi:uncharacterized flavoprotein (TIGR03862 family)
MTNNTTNTRPIVVIGGGPAGLMAAEILAANGQQVEVYDAMPSVGRKFLLAGKGGLNLTHSEPSERFLTRYGKQRPLMEPMLQEFDADALRQWAADLGIATFVGTSGRVFPTDMKAAPLLRAWLHRLREAGVHFHMRHRWLGWTEDGKLRFQTPEGERTLEARAVVLALGGGSWARLGSDGSWVQRLRDKGIAIADLRPANCGFDIAWSEFFRERRAGQPLKSIALSFTDHEGITHHRQGECVVSANGIEGSLIYALSSSLRDTLDANGSVDITLDLAPGMSAERVAEEVAHPRGSRSMSSHLQSRVHIAGVKTGLLHEVLSKEQFADTALLAHTIKALPLRLLATRPIDEAISSAGGVRFDAMDNNLMLRELPGVFCTGEMLDWEAPTGGYLLTACFATGRAAAMGVLQWLQAQPS